MWKVLVVICTLGNPCSMFEEEPMKYYHTEKECMIQAEKKSRAMTGTLVEFGYYIALYGGFHTTYNGEFNIT